jgi:hypothetical protein
MKVAHAYFQRGFPRNTGVATTYKKSDSSSMFVVVVPPKGKNEDTGFLGGIIVELLFWKNEPYEPPTKR